ncbi:MAG TPA: hypothetical protein DCE23_04305 [Firmicutes bacterium]|nr:hypothetical protein [Bacillota bacterium]
MKYNIVNSGSDGNAVIVNDVILVDCGVPFKKLQQYWMNIELVLLTHFHSDHFNPATIKKLSELRPGLRFGCCEWLLNDLLALGIPENRIDVYILNVEYNYKKFKINAFELFHDVPQCGYRIFVNDKSLIYATDTKSLNHIEAKNYDVYLIEANYESDEMLHSYAISSEYENRVRNTHMSKEDTIKWLLDNMNETSVYEFMHRHKEKPLARRFEILRPLLEKASDITLTSFKLDDDGIYACIEELIDAYYQKIEELKDFKQNVNDNYKQISEYEEYE